MCNKHNQGWPHLEKTWCQPCVIPYHCNLLFYSCHTSQLWDPHLTEWHASRGDDLSQGLGPCGRKIPDHLFTCERIRKFEDLQRNYRLLRIECGQLVMNHEQDLLNIKQEKRSPWPPCFQRTQPPPDGRVAPQGHKRPWWSFHMIIFCLKSAFSLHLISLYFCVLTSTRVYLHQCFAWAPRQMLAQRNPLAYHQVDQTRAGDWNSEREIRAWKRPEW